MLYLNYEIKGISKRGNKMTKEFNTTAFEWSHGSKPKGFGSWASVLTCVECDRKFDMTNEDDVTEYSFGHDCEV